MQPVVEIKDLTIGYGGKGAAVTVATSINATLYGGELVALVGRNGAGKSTLLRTLAGYQPPLSGVVRYAGVPEATGAAALSRLISVVLTDTAPSLNITVRELVSLGRTPYTNFIGYMRAHDKEVVESSMAAMGIHSLVTRKVATLSDGERQKSLIAKALAQETPVILLDEPTAFLDFAGKVALLRLLKKLAAEMQKTVIISSHDVELLLRVCDGLWLLDEGRLCCGTVEELTHSGAIGRFIEKDGVSYNAEERTLDISF